MDDSLPHTDFTPLLAKKSGGLLARGRFSDDSLPGVWAAGEVDRNENAEEEDGNGSKLSSRGADGLFEISGSEVDISRGLVAREGDILLGVGDNGNKLAERIGAGEGDVGEGGMGVIDGVPARCIV